MTEQPSRIAKLRSWYGRYERPISSLSLVGGFVFDAVTLKRVDLFWENFWVVAHLVIVGTCIVLIHALDKEEGAENNPSKAHFWLTNVQQFFYGGIWSTFLVFYFRSSDFFSSWPFLLILALSFIANERFKKNFVRLTFQITLFFLAIYCFAIYFVPVIFHHLNVWMFILSGIAALIFIALFLLLIQLVSLHEFKKSQWLVYSSIAGIIIVVNVLYFYNLIPPIPLSLKNTGVYYSIQRDPQGNLLGMGEQPTWRDYFTLYPTFNYLQGQPVYVYTAIFSPPKLNAKILHEWQHQDAAGKWVTVNEVPFTVNGGRDAGFRTYSEKTVGLLPGRWRVVVKTAQGQVIGTVRFNLEPADQLPNVIQQIN